MILDGILFWLTALFMALSLASLMWLAARCAVVRRRRHRNRTVRRPCGFCPTPRSVWWVNMLLPWRLLLRHACGYDLSHQAAIDPSGAVRCPECGETIAPRRRLVVANRSRPGRAAIACMMLTTASFAAMLSRGDGWVRYAPTHSLLGLRQAGVRLRREAVREELFKRVRAGDASPAAQRRFLEQLVHDLGHDRVRGNALAAGDQIVALGDVALPALREALDSHDAQRRQYAFLLAARRDAAGREEQTDERWLAVALEALGDDDFAIVGGNAAASFFSLLRHAHDRPEVEWEIVRTLRTTDDPQQRILCALICGYAGLERGMRDAFPVLLDCLADNRIAGDARAAAPAIAHFGPAGIPLLDAARAACTDSQQQMLIDLILFDLGAPSAPPARPRDAHSVSGWLSWSKLTELGPDRLLDDGGLYWLDDYAAAHSSASGRP